MTQQYLVGELSELVSLLEPRGDERLADGVHELRRRVEQARVGALGPLAAEASVMADTICWARLDAGDAIEFARQTAVAARLHEFAVSANLLP